MKRDFGKLKGENFDLIVVGGGIVGAGIARDAALRGLHTLLVEKEGFAHGTTSRSTRLIHGGLRYLRTLQFKLVRQDLREREILLKIAPHLVHRLQFVIPALRSEPFYRFSLPFGLYLYDILAKGSSLPRWRRFSRQKTLDLEPSLVDIDGLVGSYLYYDCQAEFMERLCLENVLSAAENGACILNHAAAMNLLTKNGTAQGIEVKDTLTGENYVANGRMVLNAGGHWADLMWDKLNINSTDRLRRTKGIHLLTRKVSNNALVLFAKSDGRLFFVIPLGEYSLIGTTDTDYANDLDTVYASSSDVKYLVTEMRHYFPQFGQDDIYYAMAGLRSLVASENKAASDTSRAHKLVDHEQKNGKKGFITVLGGKITAYRSIAEEALDLVCKKFGVQAPCITADTPLPGAPAVPAQDIEQATQQHGLPLETVAYLATLYGSRFSVVLNYVSADKRLGQPIVASCRDILAQIKYAVDEEEAMTLSDFLLCCTNIGLGQSQGLDAIETVAREMGLLLGWSKTEEQDQIESYRALAALGQRFRTEAIN
ncbi:MAG: glycerol-3-phosphate dehydrogenase/oxidase [Dehalococcoidales bacterium]|nr:MAG: glycerol-3-phosphate dehydrogenase/oxidase [Dehalococcoidales bacterium]